MEVQLPLKKVLIKHATCRLPSAGGLGKLLLRRGRIVGTASSGWVTIKGNAGTVTLTGKKKGKNGSPRHMSFIINGWLFQLDDEPNLLYRKWLEITISIRFLMVVWGSRAFQDVEREKIVHKKKTDGRFWGVWEMRNGGMGGWSWKKKRRKKLGLF